MEKKEAEINKAAAAAAAAVNGGGEGEVENMEEEGPSSGAEWTRRKGARRLETHVDEEDVLHLLRHDPVEMTLEEAKDWQHVKRKLGEAREKSGWFHRVEDAFVPVNSALRTKESNMKAKKDSAAAAAAAAATQEGGESGGGGGGTFIRPVKKEGEEEQVGVGMDALGKEGGGKKKSKEAEKEFGIFERSRKRMMQ